MPIDPAIEYDDFPVIVTNMWVDLAKLIHGQIPDVYIDKGPEEAMRFAWCAEACYWQARGESESPDTAKIILAAKTSQQQS